MAKQGFHALPSGTKRSAVHNNRSKPRASKNVCVEQTCFAPHKTPQVNHMRTRNRNAKRRIKEAKGDMLSQKWMTRFLAFIFILLVVVFATLSIPSVKKQVVTYAKILFYGKDSTPEPQRPRASRVRYQPPSHSFQINGQINGR